MTLTLATSVPAGISLDVQVETPGAAGFSPLQSGVTSSTIQYTPASAGTYKFQVRTAQGGSTSDWSPIVRVSVS